MFARISTGKYGTNVFNSPTDLLYKKYKFICSIIDLWFSGFFFNLPITSQAMSKSNTSLRVFKILESRNKAIRLLRPRDHIERHFVQNSRVITTDHFWVDSFSTGHLAVHGEEQR